MDPKETAIVLIEFQNEFAHPTGKNYDGVKDVLLSNQTIPHSQDLMDRARAKGCTIMHVPIAYAQGYPELPEDAFGIGCVVKQTNTFVKGTFNAEIIDEMKPQPGDIVIEGQRGIKYVAIAGFLTNVCVESTMRSAYEKGFRVYTMTDCTAALSREIQQF